MGITCETLAQAKIWLPEPHCRASLIPAAARMPASLCSFTASWVEQAAHPQVSTRSSTECSRLAGYTPDTASLLVCYGLLAQRPLMCPLNACRTKFHAGLTWRHTLRQTCRSRATWLLFPNMMISRHSRTRPRHTLAAASRMHAWCQPGPERAVWRPDRAARAMPADHTQYPCVSSAG